jgi:hypothetical protein
LEVVYPFLATGFELGVEAFRLEPFEHFRIGALGLTVAPGVGNGGEADFDAGRCAVFSEQAASELAALLSVIMRLGTPK